MRPRSLIRYMFPCFTSYNFPHPCMPNLKQASQLVVGVISGGVKILYFYYFRFGEFCVRVFNSLVLEVTTLIDCVHHIVSWCSSAKMVWIATCTGGNTRMKNAQSVWNIRAIVNNPRQFVCRKVKLSVWHSKTHLSITSGFKAGLPNPALVRRINSNFYPKSNGEFFREYLRENVRADRFAMHNQIVWLSPRSRNVNSRGHLFCSRLNF